MNKSNEKYYITTKLIAKKAQQAFRTAAVQAMKDHGYVMVAKDGWVVKEFADGTIEKIEKITPSETNELHLD